MSGAPAELFVGVDIGGSSVEAVVADPEHRVVAHAIRPTDATSSERLLGNADAAIRQVLAAVDGSAATVSGIGVGIPGQVDADSGVVRLAINLNIDGDGLAFGDAIGDAFGFPVAVENDVRAAAVGAYEMWRHEARDMNTLVYLSIGTGISAGVVIDGRLHRGRDGLAGEIGHVVVLDDGPECRCGLRGCLEAVAAGPAISRLWPSEDRRYAQALFRAARDGHAEALAAAALLTTRITEAVQWLAIGYGADLCVLGGGVGSVGEALLSAIRERLDGFARRSELARRLVAHERVVAMPEGFPTGAIGAAAVARQRLGHGSAERRSKEARTRGEGQRAATEEST